MPVVEVSGARLAYVEQGRGEAVVFVHGSLEDYRSWRFQIEPFAQRYRVIAYSRRYHFPNPAQDGPDYSAALHAGDLAELITALDLAPAHLVTSSFGGYVALYLAARRPELVRSLVLGEPPLMPWLLALPEGAPLAQAFEATAWEPARRAFAVGQTEAGVGLFLNGVIGAGAFERLSDSSRAMPLDNAAAMAAETRSQQYFSPFTCADAARIARPALLLDGERSPKLFRLITGELMRCLPDATHAMIPGASHAMHLGNSDAYIARVLAFLAQH